MLSPNCSALARGIATTASGKDRAATGTRKTRWSHVLVLSDPTNHLTIESMWLPEISTMNDVTDETAAATTTPVRISRMGSVPARR